MRARRSWLLPRALLLLVRVLAPVSLRATGVLVAWLWFVPWQDRRSVRAAAHAGTTASARGAPMAADELGAAAVHGAEATPFEVDVDGHRVVGTTVGEGPAVLLVHGWSDTSAAMDAMVVPLLERGFRVVRFDLPAHGASPGARTDIFEAAAAVRKMAERVGARRVVAHSFGGLATMVTLDGGAPIDRIVLLAPPVRLDRVVAGFATMYGLPEGAVRALQATLERRFGAAVWDELAADRRAVRFDADALVVHDREDRRTEIDGSRRLAAAWPGARLVETAGLGHRRLLREPSVIEQVVDFVTTSARSSTSA